MERKFDAPAYINRIGERLVLEFEDAGQATTPSLVGEAREVPVREQLEQILPRGIAVGSGCVIDSYGNTSQQTDVILYERDICPIFCVNNTLETTYYPCEGVIAVGEIKSSLNTATLEDSFAKIASVKRLRRHIVTFPGNLEFLPTGERMIKYRSYGSKVGPSTIQAEAFDQDNDEYSQIFGFVLSGKLELNPLTLLIKFAELVNETGDTLSPNIVVTLKDGLLYPYNKSAKQKQFSAQTATDFVYDAVAGFRLLIGWIYHAYQVCKTSDSEAFQQYWTESDPSNRYGLSVPKDGIKSHDLDSDSHVESV